MSVLQLIWRNLMYRKTLALLSILSITIATSLLLLAFLVQTSAETGAAKGYGPYELVIGATGSDTQLVLNTFYHLGSPVGNIPYQMYEEVKHNPNTEAVYPITKGDSLKGYPIIGVDQGYFSTRYGASTLQNGNWYQHTGEVVVGSYVAQVLGLRVGDQFHGSHGMVEELEELEGAAAHDEHGAEDHHKTFSYKIVGILPALHTADDKGVFTTLDYAWAVHGIEQESDRMITALLIKPKGLMELQLLKLKYNKYNGAQAVYSSKVVADVLNMVDSGAVVFNFMAMVCLVLAVISLLLALSASVQERRRDVGLLRLLGKSRLFVVNSVVWEGVLLTFIGVILGIVIGHTSAWALHDTLFTLTGISVQPWQFHLYEGTLMVGAVLLGVLASLWPSLRMYKVQPVELFR